MSELMHVVLASRELQALFSATGPLSHTTPDTIHGGVGDLEFLLEAISILEPCTVARPGAPSPPLVCFTNAPPPQAIELSCGVSDYWSS
jgi:hypothetical protein